MSSDKIEIRDAMMSINNYMKKKNINSDLQYQIREYLDYYVRESLDNKVENETKVINMLSEPLKK